MKTKKRKKSKWVNPKTGKKYMIGLGPWGSINWMSQEEYFLRQRHPEYFEGETLTEEDLTKKKEFDKVNVIVEAIIEFFLDVNTPNNIPQVTSVPASEGYYEGLIDVIRFDGLKHKRLTIQAINAAWKVWHQRYPSFPKTKGINPKYIEKKEDITVGTPEEEKEPKKKKKGNTIYGFNACSVLRRLAVEGFEYADAKKMLEHFGIEFSKSTITGQLWAGTLTGKKAKKWGEKADLTEDQINSLFEVISK